MRDIYSHTNIYRYIDIFVHVCIYLYITVVPNPTVPSLETFQTTEEQGDQCALYICHTLIVVYSLPSGDR